MRPVDAITLRESAAILDCAISTVRRHVLAGRLPEHDRYEHRSLSPAGVEALRWRSARFVGSLPGRLIRRLPGFGYQGRAICGTIRAGSWASLGGGGEARVVVSKVRGNNQGAYGQKWTRLSVAVGLAAAGVAWVAAPAWADSSIQSSGPLTSITTTSDLNCAVTVDGDTHGEWFANTACGTFLAVGTQRFGPASVPAGPTSFTAWTPVSQTAVTGTGVPGDPFTVVTVVTAGRTGLRVTQTDTYVSGSQQYTTAVTVASTATVSKNVVLYRAGDCFQQNSDTGFGRVDGTSVACVAEVPFSNPVAPSTRLEQLIPLTPGSSYIEGQYSIDVWSAVESGQPLPNTCLCGNDPNVDDVDNGVGLSWAVTIAPGSQVTERQATYFSLAPLSTSVTADDPTVLSGATDGYTVTVSNPASTDATLASITDTLPDGFSYIPGSTTGVTTADPSIAGQVLTWNGSFTVPAGGSIQLHFQVRAATALGTYFDSAGGTIGGTGGRTVNSSGPTAQIDVQPVAVTNLAPDALVVGATNDVVVTGTMFSPDATISLGAGVLVNSVNFQDETTLTANVSVAANATPGARNVVLTEADGTATCTGCFTVHAQPTITSITPSSRGQGAKQQKITIIGTRFVAGAQVTVSGSGVSVAGITQTGSTKIVATVSISAGAAPGDRTLTVTDPDLGVATGTFTVNPGPKPASASPPVSRGTSQDVTITGTNFVAGLSVKVAAAGVTVSAPSVVTPTSITVTVTASATASPGTYKLTVTNPDRGVGSKVCLTIV